MYLHLLISLSFFSVFLFGVVETAEAYWGLMEEEEEEEEEEEVEVEVEEEEREVEEAGLVGLSVIVV